MRVLRQLAPFLLVGAACGACATCAALAQQYPTRPIRLIIPMAAGGATDILIRTLTPKMTELLGQQIVVDNRPGANGMTSRIGLVG